MEVLVLRLCFYIYNNCFPLSAVEYFVMAKCIVVSDWSKFANVVNFIFVCAGISAHPPPFSNSL
jgi:hypothetical protein